MSLESDRRIWLRGGLRYTGRKRERQALNHIRLLLRPLLPLQDLSPRFIKLSKLPVSLLQQVSGRANLRDAPPAPLLQFDPQTRPSFAIYARPQQ